MKKIKAKDGTEFVVDDDDFDRLNEFKWFCRKTKNLVYAYSYAGKGRINRVQIAMHREIICAPNGLMVDHIDGDTKNNLKSNLRICSHSENMRNRKASSLNKTNIKNVSEVLINGNRRFKVEIASNGIRHRKMFIKIEDAIQHAINKRKEMHGDFYSPIVFCTY